MLLTIICPNLRCRSVLQVPESVRGEKVRCGKCGTNFMVPAAPPAPKPARNSQPATASPEQPAT